MKKSICFLSIILSVYSLSAQDSSTPINGSIEDKNEIKLNALSLVLGAFDVTYERILNEESALGMNVFIPFDDDISTDINFYVSPYYRLYFGKKSASGFFVEGFGLLSSVNVSEDFISIGQFDDPIITTAEDSGVEFAIGVGLGGKWLTKSGFIAELNLGVGRNFVRLSDSDNTIVGKVGVSLGYRF